MAQAVLQQGQPGIISGSPDDSRPIGTPWGISEAEAQRIAREICDQHRTGKENKRLRDLTAEKYAAHADGEGDAQWADIVNGSEVRIPPNLSGGLRWQWNILRPLKQNHVSYHTQIPMRVVARPASDRRSREKAIVDQIWANHTIECQRLNERGAEALDTADEYGMCPIHAQWRYDITYDAVEPLFEQEKPQGPGIQPGYVDYWVGDPWDTVFFESARKGYIPGLTYGRIIATDLVRQAFGHLPDAILKKLEGRKDMPASARKQRILRRWMAAGLGMHGTGAIHGDKGVELSALIFREIAPGYDPRYPKGLYEIAILLGTSDTDQSFHMRGTGSAVLLHRGALPGGIISPTPIYSLGRGDDPYGKPFLADLDDLQVQLNQLVTLRAEIIRRIARPPLLLSNGELEDDTVTTEDDAIIRAEGMQTQMQFAQAPTQGLQFVEKAIEATLEQIFRIGGWQAASRGESKAGDSGALVMALQQADDSIFGVDGRAFRGAICEALQKGHALARKYMTVPTLVRLTGEEWGYLAEPWIHREQLSPEPPKYEMVSGYGTTPEALGEQLIQLVQLQAADGTPVLTVEDMWRMWPDMAIRPPERSSARVREARAHAIANAIRRTVEGYRDIYAEQADSFVFEIHALLGRRYPLKRTDDLQYHIETLDEIVQDEFADPLARQVAELRQDLYFEWWQGDIDKQNAQQMAMQAQASDPSGAGAKSVAGGPVTPGAPPQAPSGASSGPATNQSRMRSDVQSLTRQASGAR